MTKGQVRVEALREWAVENLDEGDPQLMEKLYAEARRRWGDHLERRTIYSCSKQALLRIRYGQGGAS